MIAIILRGHERNSFENDYLITFFKKLKIYYKFEIYIHTWSNNEANNSWRPLEESNKIINNETINLYFNEFINNIISIKIDNDNNIEYEQSIEGKVGNINKKIWKNMWFGIKSVYDSINENIKYAFIINTRLDYFTRIKNKDKSLNIYNYIDLLIDEIKSITNYNKLYLINDFTGKINKDGYDSIDNFYFGDKILMKKLIYAFYYFLDNIILFKNRYKTFNNRNQEMLVYLECDYINNNNALYDIYINNQKLLFSIPTINHNTIKQIKNIVLFNFGCKIIINNHLNLNEIYKNNNIYYNLNNYNYSKGKGSLFIHINNFQFVVNLNIDFEYFILLSDSTEMFIKPELIKYIEKYKNGLQMIEFTEDNKWHLFKKNIHNHYKFKKILEYFNDIKYFGGQGEGNFIQKNIFMEITKLYLLFYDSDEFNDYETEEIVLQTLFYYINNKKLSLGIPFILQNYCNNINYDLDFITKIIFNEIVIPNNYIKNTLISPHIGLNCKNIYSIKSISYDINEYNNFY
jgi:hypothetical protein